MDNNNLILEKSKEYENIINSFHRKIQLIYLALISDASDAQQIYENILDRNFEYLKGSYEDKLSQALNIRNLLQSEKDSDFDSMINIVNKGDSLSAQFSIDTNIDKKMDMPGFDSKIQNSAPYKELTNYMEDKLLKITKDLNYDMYIQKGLMDMSKDDPESELLERLWLDIDDELYMANEDFHNDSRIKGWMAEMRGLYINNELVSVDNLDYDYEFFGIPLDNKTSTKSFHITTKSKLPFSDSKIDNYEDSLLKIYDVMTDKGMNMLSDSHVSLLNNLLSELAKVTAIKSKIESSKYATIVSNTNGNWSTIAISRVLSKNGSKINSQTDDNYVTINTTREQFGNIIRGLIHEISLSFRQ